MRFTFSYDGFLKKNITNFPFLILKGKRQSNIFQRHKLTQILNFEIAFFRVTPIIAEELLATDSQEKLDKLAKAQLQIVIVCPMLATKLVELKKDLNGENLFKVDKVLVMLLGVEKNQLISSNCDGSYYIVYWLVRSLVNIKCS